MQLLKSTDFIGINTDKCHKYCYIKKATRRKDLNIKYLNKIVYIGCWYIYVYT